MRLKDKRAIVLLAVVGLHLFAFACGGRVRSDGSTNSSNPDPDADGAGVFGRDASGDLDVDERTWDSGTLAEDSWADGRAVPSDAENDSEPQTLASDATADGADASQCATDDPPLPVIAPEATIMFEVVNGAAADRFVLTQAVECNAYSIEGADTLIPYQCACQCGTPPAEQLYFTRLAPGASTTLTWDARALALYYSYSNCRPTKPYCTSIAHGALQPVPPGSYVVDIVTAAAVPSGSGTTCVLMNGGDVMCTVTAQIQFGGLCAPSNIGIQAGTARQAFAVPTTGNAMVAVEVL